MIASDELEELVVEAWLASAPKQVAKSSSTAGPSCAIKALARRPEHIRRGPVVEAHPRDVCCKDADSDSVGSRRVRGPRSLGD